MELSEIVNIKFSINGKNEYFILSYDNNEYKVYKYYCEDRIVKVEVVHGNILIYATDTNKQLYIISKYKGNIKLATNRIYNMIVETISMIDEV